MTEHTRLVVCEGDETGQELLDEALRVLDPSVIGCPARPGPVRPLPREPAPHAERRGVRGGRGHGRGGPRAQGGHRHAAGDGRRRLAQPHPARRGRRLGHRPDRPTDPGRRRRSAPVVHPIVVVRMAVGDAYGADEGRTGTAGGPDEQAWRTERIDRSVCRSVAEYSFRAAAQARRLRVRRARSGRSRPSTRACSRRRWTRRRPAIPTCPTGRC